jgi:autotransporter-associated beta strand protein
MFGLKKSNKGVSARKLNIENLEERIECATKVWNGSLAGVGTNGVIGATAIQNEYGVDGDPTFSSFMASYQNSGASALGANWDPTLGQTSLPQNGDTLVFPNIADAQLATPTAGVFGDLTRIDTSATPIGPPPGPINVNLINDLSPDATGNLAGYLRDPATGANYVNPLVYVDSIQFNGSGYYLYARDNPQFGPRNSVISPVSTFPTTITAEFFYPGATNDQNTPFFNPRTFIPNLTTQVYVDPATVSQANVSLNPAVPLNIQTQMVANYAGSSLIAPLDTSTGNANWIYSPINVGNPNAPAGSSFVFNVVQEGSWLILDSDLAESNSNIDGQYILLNDVNNNKIVKQGLGILVFESNNGYTGSTSVEQGLLIISDSDGLGSALTNSNVDVSDGSLMLSIDRYGTAINGTNTVAAPMVINNRNLVLLGGDGYIPTDPNVTSSLNILNVPFGEFTGRGSSLGFFGLPHQWNGTVTLNSNAAEVTTATFAGDIYGNSGTALGLVSTGSVGTINVTNGGNGYTTAPTITIQAPNSVIVGTPTVVGGLVTRIPVLAGGAGYTSAPAVTITGNGTGATATANLTNGVVTSVTITNPGINYTLPPTVTFQGHTAAVLGAPTYVNGVITSIPVTSGGDGYLVAPTVTIVGGGGSGATAVANIANGAVISITITAGGSGYTSAPTVTLSALPVGATAGAATLVGGQITAITVANGGTGYTTAPLVVISGGGGTGATAIATLLANGLPANPNGDPSVGQEFGSVTQINGVVSGVAGLRKWGEGTIELTQANTFSGDVVIFDGFLNAQNETALGPVSTPKNIVVRELPANLLAANQQLAGALTLGDQVNGGQNLVFGSQYNLIIQDGNTSTVSNNGPDQNPGAVLGQAGARVEGLGAFQVVSPNNNPNSIEWKGTVTAQTNASIGGTPNSSLLISGTMGASSGVTLEKRGSMTLEVSSDNSSTFVGSWLVSNGDLQLSNNNALGAATSVSVTQLSPALPALSGAGSIQVNGSGLNIPTNVSIQGTGFNGFGALQSIGQNTWSGTITVAGTTSLGAGAGSELIVSGQITQAAGIPASSQLIKTGAGTVVISKAQTSLNLPISVQEGTLLIQSPGNLGVGTNQVTVSTSVPVNSATLALDGGITISNRTLNLDGTGVAGAGALRSISGDNTWGGNVNLAGTMQLAYVGVDTGTLTLSGKINGGSSTLQKTGAGTLIISGIGNNQGSTVVGAGTVYQLGQDNVPVFVNTSGTLSGNGKIGSLNMTAGQNGNVNPATPGVQGSNVAVLTTSGIRAQSSVGVFSFDLNTSGTVAGKDYDQLTVNGNVDLSGRPVLKVNLNFAPTVRGNSYTIINNDGSDPVVGTFNGQAEGSLVTALDTVGNSVSYRISYVGGTGGNDVTLTCVGVLTTNLLTSSDVVNATKYGQSVTFTSTISAVTGTVTSGTVTYFDQGVSIGQVPVAGVLNIITVSNGGTGYTSAPTITISGGGGTGAAAIATVVNGVVTGIMVTNGGSGYTGTPTITITGGAGVGAAATSSLTYGIATFTTTTLSVNGSPHVITSAFVGQGIFADSDSNIVTQRVNKSSSSITVTTDAFTENSTAYGQDLPLTITATVTPQYAGGPATGQVLFQIDGIPQPLQTISATVTDPTTGATTATLLTSISTTGFHTIDALYLGDSNVNGSDFSPIINQQILPTAITTLDLVSSRNPADRLATITFTANVNYTGIDPITGVFPVDSGYVEFLDNGVVIEKSTSATGVFTCTTSNLAGGRHTITAKYLGSPNGFNSSPHGPISSPQGPNTMYFSSSTATIYQAVSAISNLVVTGTNEGGGPQVNVYNLLTQETTKFFAFAPSFMGGVRVASGDVTGDGVNDVVVAAGPGGGPQVNVYDGTSLQLTHSFYAYNAAFDDGIFVAVGDVNGDGYADIITGAGQGGGPHVQVFSGQNYSNIASFFAYNPAFTGGISVASGDVNGDGYSDVVVGAGPGGGPHVLAVSGFQLSQGTQVVLASFFAFDPGINRGVFVGAGDYNGDIVGDIVVAAGPGGGPHVKVFNGSGTSLIDTFFAYDINFAGGLSVVMADIDNDGLAEIVTAPYTNGGPEVKVFRYQKGQLYNFYAYDPLFTGGVFVG